MADYIKLDADEVARQIDRLVAEWPELLEDEALRQDMIAGETDLDKVIARALDHMSEADTMVAAIAMRCAQQEERKGRHERRSTAMRSLILSLMQKANLPKIALPEASISISAGRESVVITDAASVPRQLGTSSWSPDKKAIAKQIAAGVDVPGAVMQKGPNTLRVSKK